MRLRRSKKPIVRTASVEKATKRLEAVVETIEAREAAQRLLAGDTNWKGVPDAPLGNSRGTMTDLASALQERIPKVFSDVMPVYCVVRVVKVEADEDVTQPGVRKVRVHLRVSAG